MATRCKRAVRSALDDPSVAIEVEWTKLTREQRDILVLVAIPVAAGLSYTEIASQIGRPPSWCARKLKWLRETLPLESEELTKTG
jgi:O6-methylguanine-DNA--protein-cysteine methyltransferase